MFALHAHVPFQVREKYPELEYEEVIVDNCCMQLVGVGDSSRGIQGSTQLAVPCAANEHNGLPLQ